MTKTYKEFLKENGKLKLGFLESVILYHLTEERKGSVKKS